MRHWFCGLIFVSQIITVASGDEAADLEFFESKVRPVLVARCYECHSSDKPRAGLRLDSRHAVLTGGESGPAAVAGKPDESLLVDVVGYRNGIQMPPKSKLPESEIAAITEWVRRGLPWPDSPADVATPAAAAPVSTEFTDEQKSFWAFQPVRRTTPPEVPHDAWSRTSLDSFILAEMNAHGLEPAREADRRTLLRRITVDLTGLLPSPEETADFVNDPAEDAFERVVDRLLASPRYGERWARHWLDVARYADSNGLDENMAYAHAYRYRDYVVRAMREDKPYDRFLIEQIAGDLLPETSVSASNPFDPLIATGFLCLGAKMLAEDDPVKMQMDIIDEQVDTIARAFMGLTMGCARCHDHKYDPLTTEDYYGLAGVLKSTQTMDTFTVVALWHERPLATASQRRQQQSLKQLAAEKKSEIDKLRSDTVFKILVEARKDPAAYLLAATKNMLLAERLASAVPFGNQPDAIVFNGSILIEAENYVRGNVLRDRDNYGKEIGVLVNRGETPNFTEYDVNISTAGTYQLELRYAAAAARPVKIFIDSRLARTDAANKVTGSWTPESQTWFAECIVPLAAGRHTIRLEQPQFFPHIDKLLLTPVNLPDIAFEAPPTDSPLIGSLVDQWRKTLQATKADSSSILAGWHQFLSTGQLTIDPDHAANGTERLLGDHQPASLVELAQRYARLMREAELAPNPPSDPVVVNVRSLIDSPTGPWTTPADIETVFPAELIAQLREDRAELARREAAVPQFPETMAVEDATPENLKIHLRGSHLTLGREVPRQLPRILCGDEPRELTGGSGRLALAEWLARPQHPLTGRVMVNRLWQWHFGNGLVRSADNFGRLGERPSHPQLLDWLADEFARGGNASNPARAFSMKTFHRMLVGSATYRQSTRIHPDAPLKDPENRLLSSFPRQRMEVEVLRDTLLQLSGQLDETAGGTLMPTANRTYVTSTSNVDPGFYHSNRRSIYLPVVRSALYQVFTAFDFADPSTLAGRRDTTTIAPQALFMMNSDLVLEQVRQIVARLIKSDVDDASRLKALYVMAYSREPTTAEVARDQSYLQRLKAALASAGVPDAEIETRGWVSLCRVVLSANEYIYIE